MSTLMQRSHKSGHAKRIQALIDTISFSPSGKMWVGLISRFRRSTSRWQAILPPVNLDQWPDRVHERFRRFSTVADWRGSQVAIFEEAYYGTKCECEFVRFLTVPMQANQRIELALCIGQHDFEDLRNLLGHDWRVSGPGCICWNS